MGSPIDQQILTAAVGVFGGKKDKPRAPGVPAPEKVKEEDQKKRIASIGRLALVNTSPSGLLNPTTGRKKLSA